MEKTFKYFRCTHAWADEVDGYDFEYTVDESDLLDAVVELIYEDYFYNKENDYCYEVGFITTVKKGIRKQIEQEDTLQDYVERYEDELKEYFEEEAMEGERND